MNEPNGQLGRIEANVAHLVKASEGIVAEQTKQGRAIAVIQEQHSRCPFLERGEMPVRLSPASVREDSPSGVYRRIEKQSGMLGIAITLIRIPAVQHALVLLGILYLANVLGFDLVKIIPALGPPTP